MLAQNQHQYRSRGTATWSPTRGLAVLTLLLGGVLRVTNVATPLLAEQTKSQSRRLLGSAELDRKGCRSTQHMQLDVATCLCCSGLFAKQARHEGNMQDQGIDSKSLSPHTGEANVDQTDLQVQANY